jgi:hypothetical protein
MDFTYLGYASASVLVAMFAAIHKSESESGKTRVPLRNPNPNSLLKNGSLCFFNRRLTQIFADFRRGDLTIF